MHLQSFTDRDTLENALVRQLVTISQEAISTKGICTILFSGGSTPKALMNKLAASSLDWSKIQVGLVDDRMVDSNSSYSNALLIQNELMHHIPTDIKPRFIPLVTDSKMPEKNLQITKKAMMDIGHIDICLLGMGTDGHFASIFPNDPASDLALIDENDQSIYLTNAPAHPTNRITCSWPYLANSTHLFLHITGDTKYDILHGELLQSLPIHQVTESHCAIFWAP